MKAIFTYPNNAATSYIDPLYVGDASDGFQKRIQDLKDGNYLPWSGTAPVDTVSDLMSNISKFNDYYWDRGEFHHVSIHDMYLYPLLIGTKELIEADVASSLKDANGSVLFGTIYAHDMHDGQKILITGMDGSFGQYYNNQELYVKDEGGTFGIGLKFFADSALTNEILFYDLERSIISGATADSPCLFTDAAHDLTTGTEVLMSGFDGDIGDNYNGQTFYAQVIDNTTYNLSVDAAGTSLVGFLDVGSIAPTVLELVNDDTVNFETNSDLTDYPDSDIVITSPIIYRRTKITAPSTQSEQTTLMHAGGIKKFMTTGNNNNVIDEYHLVNDEWTYVRTVGVLGTGERLVSMGGAPSTIITATNTTMKIYERTYMPDAWTAYSVTNSSFMGARTNIKVSGDGQTIFMNNPDYSPSGGQQGGVTIYTKDPNTGSAPSWGTRLSSVIYGPYSPSVVGENHGSMGWGNRSDQELNFDVNWNGTVFAASVKDYNSSTEDANRIVIFKKVGTTWSLYDDITIGTTGPLTNTTRISLSGDGTHLAFTQRNGWVMSPTLQPTTQSGFEVYVDDGISSYSKFDDSYTTTDTIARISFDYGGNRLLLGANILAIYTKGASSYTMTEQMTAAYTGLTTNVLGHYASMALFSNGDKAIVTDKTSLGGEAYVIWWVDAALIAKSIFDRYPTVYGRPLAAGQYKYYTDNTFTTAVKWEYDPSDPTPILALQDLAAGDYSPSIANSEGRTTFVKFTPALILTDSTVGTLDEVYTPPNQYTIPVQDYVAATTGHLTISTSETNRYRLLSLNLSIPGSADYGYLNTSGVRVPGAEVNYTMARDAGGTPSVFGLQPDITIATDSSGHVTGATITTNGTFPTDGELVFPIQEPPSQYVPPAPNTAADEDIFDTQDAWTNLSGYQGAGKMFGKDIIPTTASITYVQPSTTNMSQNGRKYVRSSGFVKTKLEVNYTNLTKAEFQELHADAQAARGQAATFYLVVGLWGGKVLNFYANASRSNPRLVTPYAAGETLLKLGGFNSNEQDVFKKGEMIIGNNGNENGDLLTVLNTVDANVYGEAKIRVAYGNPYSAINGTKVFKNPYWIVVSLDSDEFQYTVDTFGLYNVTVGFETGSYT